MRRERSVSARQPSRRPRVEARAKESNGRATHSNWSTSRSLASSTACPSAVVSSTMTVQPAASRTGRTVFCAVLRALPWPPAGLTTR